MITDLAAGRIPRSALGRKSIARPNR